MTVIKRPATFEAVKFTKDNYDDIRIFLERCALNLHIKIKPDGTVYLGDTSGDSLHLYENCWLVWSEKTGLERYNSYTFTQTFCAVDAKP